MNIKYRRKVTVKMKRKKLCTMIMGLVFSFSLTGCGTSLYEMTADEEDVPKADIVIGRSVERVVVLPYLVA